MQVAYCPEMELRYKARDRDFVATVGLRTQVEPLQLKSGKWRAYLRNFVTPNSNHGQEAETKEVVRDGYGDIITGISREELITKLKTEYPGWKWVKPEYKNVMVKP